VSLFINDNFIPLNVHIKENPKNFRRFGAVWTPTVLILDPEGTERRRLEGYFPKDDFRAFLEMGLARLAFIKKDWPNAERRYSEVIEDHPDSHFVPQAIYYRGVSRYSASHVAIELVDTAKILKEKYQGNEWHLRSVCWLQERSETTTG